MDLDIRRALQQCKEIAAGEDTRDISRARDALRLGSIVKFIPAKIREYRWCYYHMLPRRGRCMYTLESQVS